MNIGADEKKHIARYLNFLLCCEHIAHDCSAKQAKLCDDKQMKRFLLKQSRQEKFHAVTFRSGILLLSPKGASTPAIKQTQRYRSLLENATDNHDLLSSIIGLQVILEGMADVALTRLDHGIKQHDTGLKKVRHAILTQEDAHHVFGLNYLKANFSSKETHPHADDYLSVICEMLTSLQGLFDFFDEDSTQYLTDFKRNLPEHINCNALDHRTYA